MEEIITLKKKNSPNSPTKIKEILTQISNARCENNKIIHKLGENETRINDLSKEVSTLKDEFQNEKQSLESKVHELEECNCILQNLREDKQNLDITLKELEKRHKTMKNRKPSLNDQQLLERGKRKHQLYKEFTGIRWDYSALPSVIEGYITNKKDYLKKISYKSNIDYKTLRDLAWEEIHQSTLDSTARKDKENNPVNK